MYFYEDESEEYEGFYAQFWTAKQHDFQMRIQQDFQMLWDHFWQGLSTS